MRAWVWLAALTAGCATAARTGVARNPTLERISALEDARTDAEGELEAFLTEDEPAVRVRCATALGRMPYPELGAEVTRALLEALRDPEADVRATAAFALGVRGDPSAADKLVFAALDHHDADPDPLVRARAIEAASKLDRPELRLRLLDGLLDADPRVRLETAQGASRWPADAAFDARLVEHVKHETDRDVVLYSLFALERRKAAAALSTFERFAGSDDAEQRIFAVRGLKALVPDPVAVGALWRAVEDPDWRVACEAVLGLGAAKDEASSELLVAKTRHGSPHVRRCAWEALSAVASRLDDRERLDHLLDDASEAEEQSSAVKTAMLECREVVSDQIDQTWNDDLAGLGRSIMLFLSYVEASSETRVALARAAGRRPASGRAPGNLLHLARANGSLLGDELRVRQAKEPLSRRIAQDELDVLLAALAAPQPLIVREAAIESLAKHPSPETRALLHELLADPDNGIRLAAVTSLAEMPDPNDLEPLERCYTSSVGDGSTEIRFNVLRNAGKIKGDAAAALIARGLLDEQPFVRRVAADELRKLGRDVPELAPPAREPVELDLPRYRRAAWVDVVTTKGTLRFELFPDETPVHVHNFLELARRGHYDGTLFHRVVPDFVIQGGDYRGDGNGGGTWRGDADSLRHEITPRKYVRGSLGMPRNDDVDSGGSQIFVTHRPTPHLDGRYTIFGELREGFDVLDAIEIGDRILRVEIPR